MIELKKKLEITNLTISKLDKRIKDLELLSTKVNQRLNEESLKRMEIQNIQLTSSEGNNFQIATLKESIEKLANIFNSSLNELKTSLTQDINTKTSSLQQIIEEKTNSIDDVIKSNSEYEIIQKNLSEEVKKRISKMEEELNSSLKAFKEEINEKGDKVDNFEKIVNDDHKFLEEQIGNINLQFSLLEKENKINKTFKTNMNKSLADIESNLRAQKENVNKLKNNYDTQITNYEEKITNFYNMIRNESDSMRNVQDDIYRHLEIIDNKNMTKLKELSDYYNKEINMQQSEIEHFEKHLLEEHAHFSNFFQEKLQNFEENVNKNVCGKDNEMKQIKKSINNIKDENDNLKQKINDSINELNKYHSKKNDSLLKILMSNNLVPPDFDYNSFCSWNGDNYFTDECQTSNRNNYVLNNNYNEQNSS